MDDHSFDLLVDSAKKSKKLVVKNLFDACLFIKDGKDLVYKVFDSLLRL